MRETNLSKSSEEVREQRRKKLRQEISTLKTLSRAKASHSKTEQVLKSKTKLTRKAEKATTIEKYEEIEDAPEITQDVIDILFDGYRNRIFISELTTEELNTVQRLIYPQAGKDASRDELSLNLNELYEKILAKRVPHGIEITKPETPTSEDFDPELRLRQDKDENKETLAKLEEVIARTTKRLREIEDELATIRARRRVIQETIKIDAQKLEAIYPLDLITTAFEEVLKSIDNVQDFEDLKLNGKDKTIEVSMRVSVNHWLLGLIRINVKSATLESENGIIVVRDYKIEADQAQGQVEKKIKSKLGSVSEKIKEYIEEKEKRKVVKMEIESGQLKVIFKK